MQQMRIPVELQLPELHPQITPPPALPPEQRITIVLFLFHPVVVLVLQQILQRLLLSQIQPLQHNHWQLKIFVSVEQAP